MEQGKYYIFIGKNAAQTEMAGCLELSGTVLMSELHSICPLLTSLTEIEPEDELVEAWEKEFAEICRNKGLPVISMDREVQEMRAEEETKRSSRENTGETEDEASRLAEQLTLMQKAMLVCGRVKDGGAEVIGNASVTVPGAAGETTWILEEPYQIGSIVLADGPAGLRLQKHYEENPADGSIYSLGQIESLENRIFQKEFLHEGSVSHYQFCSAIPVGTHLGPAGETLNIIRRIRL